LKRALAAAALHAALLVPIGAATGALRRPSGLATIALLITWSTVERWAVEKVPRSDRPGPLARRLAYASGVAVLATALITLARGGSSQPAGWVLAAIGILLRTVAILDLGPAFTSALPPTSRSSRRLDPHDRAVGPTFGIVKSGVYRWMRHPSEVGLLLIGGGIAWGAGCPDAMGPVVFVLVPASFMRLRREERLLAAMRG
jgi:hypothetical protein